MNLNFYPKPKLTLSSLKKVFVLSLLLVGSFGYAYSQTVATALAFDGVGSVVSIPPDGNTNPLGSLNISSSITLETWIYATKSSGVQDVLSKSSSNINNGYIFPRTSNGWRNVQFLLNINGFGWQILEVPYGLAKLNQWHHLAATYDGYIMSIYIDGVLAGTKSFAGSITTNTNPLTIGGHPGYVEFFTGKVDEARIWSRALTGCEINNNLSCELPAGQNGLIAYYKFNQGFVNSPNPSETILYDASGYGNNGMLNGFLLTGTSSNWVQGIVSGSCAVFTPVAATASAASTTIPVGSDISLFATGGGTYAWTGPNGFTSTQQNPVLTGVGATASGVYTVTVTKNGCTASASVTVTVAQMAGALNFDGETNLVVVPNRPNLNPNTGLTVETWIKPTSTSPAVQNVVSKSNRVTNTGYIFPRTDDGWRSFSFWLDVNGQWRVLSAQLPALNQWNHVAATYDGFFMKIYLNGTLVGTQEATGTAVYNNDDLTIGLLQGAFEYFKGSVDETRIWSRPLTQCEIQNNLYCELNGANNGLASQTGLSAYFRYNQGLVNAVNSSYTILADSSGNNNHGTLQGFALSGTSSNWTNGTVTATCSPFSGSQAVASSNGPNVEVGSTVILTASAGTNWSWVGPNNFSSTLQNPTIPNAAANATGTYTVTITGGGCTSSASTKVTVAYKAGTLSFDGVNDQVVVPHQASQDITKAITIESWVYPTNRSQLIQNVMCKSTSVVNNGYIFPRTDSGWDNFVFYLHINGQFQKLTAPFPGINQWHHLAATYDGYFMRIYLDGQLVNTKPMSGDITVNANDLVLGSQPGYGEFFQGKVDESRIWNRALSQCEIINNMNCELAPSQNNGLVAYYKYNQGFVDAGNADVPVLFDASSNANNGTLTDFALQGSTSNWSVFKVTTTCSLYSQPPVTAVSNASIFGVGSTIQLFATGGTVYTWAGPNNFYSDISHPVIANVPVEASGVYTVTAHFVNCVANASTRVTVQALSQIVADGPTVICPSGSVGLSIADAGQYQWFKNDVLIPGATGSTYRTGETGNYAVRITNSFGDVLMSAPISVRVEDTEAPIPDLAVLPILHIATPGTISTIPTARDNCKGIITATTSSPLTSYNTPGTYTITWVYDDGNGHVVYQDQQVVVVLGLDIVAPVVTVPASITANALIATNCGAVVNFTATATDNSGLPVSITYSQDPGTVFATGNTIVTVTAMDAANNISTGTFTVTVLPTTVAPVTGILNLCAGSTTALSSATAGGVWSSDDTTIAKIDASGMVTGITAGTVTIKYTNACGVFASAAVTVKALPSAPTVTVSDNCGNSVLTASNITGSLTWSTGETTASITVQAGTFTAVQSGNGCISLAATAVAAPKTIPAAPTVTVSDNCGNSVLTASNLTGNLLWSTGETTVSIVVAAGTYTVTQNANGCISPVATAVAAPKVVPSAPILTVNNYCGSSVLTASNISGSLAWSTGETTVSIVVAAGTYTATQNLNGCVSPVAIITAVPKTIPSTPEIIVTNYCGYTTLSTSAAGLYLWSNGATASSINVTTAGNYSVKLTNAEGCFATSASIPVTINTAPVVAGTTGSTTVTVGATTQLANTTPNGAWSSNSTNATVNAAGLVTGVSVGNATISYTVTSTNGCSTTVYTTISVQPDCIVPAFTATASNITVNTAPGLCTAAVSYTIMASGTPSPTYSYTFSGATTGSGSGTGSGTNFMVGTTQVLVVAANGCGAVPARFTITVQDNTAPVITGMANQVFCTIASVYTIPTITVTDNCSIASVVYQVSGATSRTGTGTNASGVFNPGISTITWTATDGSGKTSTGSETVTVGGPVATIAVSTNDVCSNVTLTGASSINNAAYRWALGSATVSTAAQLGLKNTDPDGIYQLFVTANGCTSTAATYHYQKQNLTGSYTILAFDEVEIGKYNKVVAGSIGIMSWSGEVEFKKNSSVSGAGAFVKSPRIERDGSGINIANTIYGIATVALPVMQYNTASVNNLPNYTVSQNAVTTLNGNYKKLTVRKGASVSLNGNTFGTIEVEAGASVRFSNTVLNIEKLIVNDGANDGYYSYVRFAPGSSIRIADKVSIGSQVIVNPDYNNIGFFMGDQKSDKEKFTVKGANTKVIANIYMPKGKLKVHATDDNDDDDHDHDACDHKAHYAWNCKHNGHNHKNCDHKAHNGSDCNDDVYMTGLFIVEDLESKGNTVIWSSFTCGSAAIPVVTNNNTVVSQAITGEEKTTVTEAAKEDLKITVMPNPSTTYFTLKLESKYETPVNMKVMDASGRVVDARTKIGSNSTIQIGANYASGTYYAEMVQGGTRKLIQLIKVRG